MNQQTYNKLLVYTHENRFVVENISNCLKLAGIDAQLRNAFATGAMGELAPTDTWPELWVEDSDFAKAQQVIDTLLSKAEGKAWYCSQCGEENAASFEICWQCQTEQP